MQLCLQETVFPDDADMEHSIGPKPLHIRFMRFEVHVVLVARLPGF